jgi:hypothetical protein
MQVKVDFFGQEWYARRGQENPPSSSSVLLSVPSSTVQVSHERQESRTSSSSHTRHHSLQHHLRDIRTALLAMKDELSHCFSDYKATLAIHDGHTLIACGSESGSASIVPTSGFPPLGGRHRLDLRPFFCLSPDRPSPLHSSGSIVGDPSARSDFLWGVCNRGA